MLYLIGIVYAIPEGYIRHERGCAWSNIKGFKSKEHIINPLPYVNPIIPTAQLPTNFSWDDQNGISLVTPVRNQGLPYNCGSCWVWGFILQIIEILYVCTYYILKTGSSINRINFR